MDKKGYGNPFGSSYLSEIKRETSEAFNDPKAGDRFEEFYTCWVYVLKTDGGKILTWQGSGHPSGFPNVAHHGRFVEYESIESFQKAFSYGTTEGYFVKLCDRGNDISRFLLQMEAAS